MLYLKVISLTNQIKCISINRPKQLNALNKNIIDELHQTIVQFENDKKIKAFIITGEGNKSFVAGADLAEMQNFTQKQAYNFSRIGQQCFETIAKSNKPVLAAINGYALGGGLELAMSCHFRIASENSRMGLPETSLGLIPGFGGTQRLPKIIGQQKALEFILSGRIIKPQQAYQCGLIHSISSLENLIHDSVNFLNEIINKPLSAIAATMACFYHHIATCDLEKEAQQFACLFDTYDAKEGIQAFIEKRQPHFTNQ